MELKTNLLALHNLKPKIQLAGTDPLKILLTTTSRLPFARTSTKGYASSATVGISTYAKYARNLVTMPWLATARKDTTRVATTISKTMVMVETMGTGITTKTGDITKITLFKL